MPNVKYNLTADPSGFQKGFASAESQAQKFAQGLAGNAGAAGQVLSAMGPAGLVAAAGIGVAAVAVGALGAKLVDATGQAAKYGETIKEAIDRSGMAAESFQKMAFAVGQAGVSSEAFSGGISKMQKALVDAGNSGTSVFARLGLSVKELRDLAPEQQFEAVGAAIQKLSDPADRAAASMEVFGKSGADMLKAFTSNLTEAQERAERLGLVMSSQTIDGLDAFKDETDALNQTWSMFWNNVGASIATTPALRQGIASITDALGSLSVWVQQNQSDIQEWTTAAITPIADVTVSAVRGVTLLGDAMRMLSGATNKSGTSLTDWLRIAADLAFPGAVPLYDKYVKGAAGIGTYTGGTSKYEPGEGRYGGSRYEPGVGWMGVVGGGGSGWKTEAQLKADAAAAKEAAAEFEKLEKQLDSLAQKEEEGLLKGWLEADREAMKDWLAGMGALQDELESMDASGNWMDPNEKAGPYTEDIVTGEQAWKNLFDLLDAKAAEDGPAKQGFDARALFGDLGGAAADLADLFRDFGVDIGSALGELLKGIQAGAGASNVFGAAGAAYNSGSMWGGLGAGAAYGAQFGIVGAAVGGLVGSVLGIFGEGKAEAERAAEQARKREQERQEKLRIVGLAKEGRASAAQDITQIAPEFFSQRPILTEEDARRQGIQFAAAWGLVVKEKGIVAAAAAFGDSFKKMRSDMDAAGVSEPAWVTEMAGLMELGLDEEFQNIAAGAQTAAQFLKALGEAGVLGPELLATFEDEARRAFGEGKTRAGGLGATEEEAVKAGFAAANPLLKELLNQSILSNTTLSPDIEAMIKESGVVADIDYQQLDELRAIRAAVENLAWDPTNSSPAPPPGGGPGGGDGGGGGTPGYVPKFKDGGFLPESTNPEGTTIQAAEPGTGGELMIPGRMLGALGGITIQVNGARDSKETAREIAQILRDGTFRQLDTELSKASRRSARRG